MKKFGSRAQVMHGTAKMTSGGLMKKHLKYNKQGKIVSKKASNAAKKSKNLIKAGYITKKGKFGAVKIVKGGTRTKNIINSIKKEKDISKKTDYIITKLIEINKKHSLYPKKRKISKFLYTLYKSNILSLSIMEDVIYKLNNINDFNIHLLNNNMLQELMDQLQWDELNDPLTEDELINELKKSSSLNKKNQYQRLMNLSNEILYASIPSNSNIIQKTKMKNQINKNIKSMENKVDHNTLNTYKLILYGKYGIGYN